MTKKKRQLTIPNWLKLTLKFLILAAIIYIIVRKIDEKTVLNLIRDANLLWLIWALLFFALSKFIAALRFNTLLRTESIQMTTWQNVRLYWLCMYYNLLLPGGISGDAYKIKVLMDQFNKPFKRLLAITLLDRISGVIALGQLGLGLLFFIPVTKVFWYWIILGLLLTLLLVDVLYRWFKAYPAAWINTLQSLGVQGAQVIAVYGLILALGQQQHWADYLVLFLISSLVAMLPITIGGAGAREITFLYGATFLAIDQEKAVTIAFMFYIVSTMISFLGIIYSFKKKPIDPV
jgi:uncharacterized membrane protein YbhN (UPF0104 family)